MSRTLHRQIGKRNRRAKNRPLQDPYSASKLFHVSCLGLAGVGAVDALSLEGDRLGELGRGAGIGGSDLDRRNLDAHLVVLAVGLGAGVLLVGATTLAATVIEDGDHGGAARLVHLGLGGGAAEEGGSHGSGGAGLHDLAAASLHGHHGGEGGGGGDDGGEGDGAHGGCVVWALRGEERREIGARSRIPKNAK